MLEHCGLLAVYRMDPSATARPWGAIHAIGSTGPARMIPNRRDYTIPRVFGLLAVTE
jgi:hypothetical protein